MSSLQARLNEERKERLARMKAWAPRPNYVALERVRPVPAKPIPQRDPLPPPPLEPPKPPPLETWFRFLDDEDLSYLTIPMIQKAVALHFGVTVLDICSARRTAEVIQPRMVAVWLCRRLTPKSLLQIGRRFGGRDHTTVLHAIRRIDGIMESDLEFRSEVMSLFDRLQAIKANP